MASGLTDRTGVDLAGDGLAVGGFGLVRDGLGFGFRSVALSGTARIVPAGVRCGERRRRK